MKLTDTEIETLVDRVLARAQQLKHAQLNMPADRSRLIERAMAADDGACSMGSFAQPAPSNGESPKVRCFRHKSGFLDGVDRVRFTGDACETVYPGGHAKPGPWSLREAEEKAARGLWIECPDTPASPSPEPSPQAGGETAALVKKCRDEGGRNYGPIYMRRCLNEAADAIERLQRERDQALGEPVWSGERDRAAAWDSVCKVVSERAHEWNDAQPEPARTGEKVVCGYLRACLADIDRLTAELSKVREELAAALRRVPATDTAIMELAKSPTSPQDDGWRKQIETHSAGVKRYYARFGPWWLTKSYTWLESSNELAPFSAAFDTEHDREHALSMAAPPPGLRKPPDADTPDATAPSQPQSGENPETPSDEARCERCGYRRDSHGRGSGISGRICQEYVAPPAMKKHCDECGVDGTCQHCGLPFPQDKRTCCWCHRPRASAIGEPAPPAKEETERVYTEAEIREAMEMFGVAPVTIAAVIIGLNNQPKTGKPEKGGTP